jgi:hypothetical protein
MYELKRLMWQDIAITCGLMSDYSHFHAEE